MTRMLLLFTFFLSTTAQATTFGECLEDELEAACTSVAAQAVNDCPFGAVWCDPTEAPIYTECILNGEEAPTCEETCEMYTPGVELLCATFGVPTAVCDAWTDDVIADCEAMHCTSTTPCVDACEQTAQVDENICLCLGGSSTECEDFGQDSLGNCTYACY